METNKMAIVSEKIIKNNTAIMEDLALSLKKEEKIEKSIRMIDQMIERINNGPYSILQNIVQQYERNNVNEDSRGR